MSDENIVQETVMSVLEPGVRLLEDPSFLRGALSNLSELFTGFFSGTKPKEWLTRELGTSNTLCDLIEQQAVKFRTNIRQRLELKGQEVFHRTVERIHHTPDFCNPADLLGCPAVLSDPFIRNAVSMAVGKVGSFGFPTENTLQYLQTIFADDSGNFDKWFPPALLLVLHSAGSLLARWKDLPHYLEAGYRMLRCFTETETTFLAGLVLPLC